MGVASRAPQSNDVGLAYGVSTAGGSGRDGTTLLVPLNPNRISSDSEPTVIEDIRVRPRNSLATRHWTVVKKGDRIVSVIKAELNQRPLDGPSESDFDL